MFVCVSAPVAGCNCRSMCDCHSMRRSVTGSATRWWFGWQSFPGLSYMIVVMGLVWWFCCHAPGGCLAMGGWVSHPCLLSAAVRYQAVWHSTKGTHCGGCALRYFCVSPAAAAACCAGLLIWAAAAAVRRSAPSCWWLGSLVSWFCGCATLFELS